MTGRLATAPNATDRLSTTNVSTS